MILQNISCISKIAQVLKSTKLPEGITKVRVQTKPELKNDETNDLHCLVGVFLLVTN